MHSIILQALALLSLNEGYVEAQREFIADADDNNQVAEYVEKFKQLVTSKQIKGKETSIDYWRGRGWSAFKHTIDQLNKSHQPDPRDEILLETDKWLVIVPHDPNSHCYYGKHAQWCKSANKQWNTYEVGVVYFLDIVNQTRWILPAYSMGDSLLCNDKERTIQFDQFKDESGIDVTAVVAKSISLNTHKDTKTKYFQDAATVTSRDANIERSLLLSNNTFEAVRYCDRLKFRWDKLEARMLTTILQQVGNKQQTGDNWALYQFNCDVVKYFINVCSKHWPELFETIKEVTQIQKLSATTAVCELLFELVNNRVVVDVDVMRSYTMLLIAVATIKTVESRLTLLTEYFKIASAGDNKLIVDAVEQYAIANDSEVAAYIHQTLNPGATSPEMERVYGKYTSCVIAYVKRYQTFPPGGMDAIAEKGSDANINYLCTHGPRNDAPFSDSLEDRIAKRANTAYKYARYMLEDRFELGEEALTQDIDYLACYARDVLKAPWKTVTGNEGLDNRILNSIKPRVTWYRSWLAEFAPKTLTQLIKRWFKTGEVGLVSAMGGSPKSKLKVRLVSTREVPDEEEVIYRYKLTLDGEPIRGGSYSMVVQRVNTALNNDHKLKHSYVYVTLDTSGVDSAEHKAVIVDLTLDAYTGGTF